MSDSKKIPLFLLCLIPLVLSGCAMRSVTGSYSAYNRLALWSGRLEITDDNRFFLEEYYEAWPITTSGSYRLSGRTLVLNSDTTPIKDSYFSLSGEPNPDSLFISTYYEDVRRTIIRISSKVRAEYFSGRISYHDIHDHGFEFLERQNLKEITISSLASMPLTISVEELTSNNLRVFLVEDSRGNTRLVDRAFHFKGNRLIRSGEIRTVYRRGGS